MSFFNPISLKNQFEIPISATTIDNYISTHIPDNFSIENINDGEYKAIANFSLGTLVIGAIHVEGIKTKVILDSIDAKSTIVTLKTGLRIELFIVLIMIVIFVFSGVLSSEGTQTWIKILLFPVMPIWFWLVYRVQESMLQKK